MRRLLAALVAVAFATLAIPAFAQTDADVLDQIETLHGDSEGFVAAFELLRESFVSGDASTLADMAVYPLTVEANGETYDVLSGQDLVDNAMTLVTPETVEAMGNQSLADLIVTSDGVGLANGAMWMALVCSDDSCSDSYWGVIRINN
ncbi:hypothetical protein [Devosia aquimaris]|uniref:hypothetical protein n=1 Tax=Devosia aquimaris TaxID=2866214 RepID=UPI001CD17A0A|nr:hypothetical protein [Devosia sp. CJK-A8-3]